MRLPARLILSSRAFLSFLLIFSSINEQNPKKIKTTNAKMIESMAVSQLIYVYINEYTTLSQLIILCVQMIFQFKHQC